MSSLHKESINEHIWQCNDLDANTTSVCFVDRKYVDNVFKFNTKIKEVEKETNCLITTHGIENQTGVVWIRIKNKSPDSRRLAYLLINAFTNESCKEIVIPKLPEQTATTLNDLNIIQNKSTQNTSSSNILNSAEYKARRKTLTRSSTDNFISNSNKSSSTPFGSILAPFTNDMTSNKSINPIIEDDENDLNHINNLMKNLETQKQQQQQQLYQSINKTAKEKKRYTVDFLLARSDVPNSKKLPKNWKELNLKYPNICFCGKVISYFNPYKYYDHWIKTQNQNPELHYPIPTIINKALIKNTYDSTTYRSSSQTDDYLGLKYRDFSSNSDNQFSSKFSNNLTTTTTTSNHHNHHHNNDLKLSKRLNDSNNNNSTNFNKNNINGNTIYNNNQSIKKKLQSQHSAGAADFFKFQTAYQNMQQFTSSDSTRFYLNDNYSNQYNNTNHNSSKKLHQSNQFNYNNSSNSSANYLSNRNSKIYE